MTAEHGTGSFPTMGTSAAHLANVAKPEKGRSRPRGVSKGGSDAHMGTKGSRGQVYGRMGASLHPVMKMSQPNEPCAADTGRNVHQMPSKSSWTDNWRTAARKLQG